MFLAIKTGHGFLWDFIWIDGNGLMEMMICFMGFMIDDGLCTFWRVKWIDDDLLDSSLQKIWNNLSVIYGIDGMKYPPENGIVGIQK